MSPGEVPASTGAKISSAGRTGVTRWTIRIRPAAGPSLVVNTTSLPENERCQADTAPRASSGRETVHGGGDPSCCSSETTTPSWLKSGPAFMRMASASSRHDGIAAGSRQIAITVAA